MVILEDIKNVLADLPNMDDEHGAFWVSVIKDGENVLETRKDLKVKGIFEQESNIQYDKQCKDLIEIQNLYSLLLKEDFVGLKNQLQTG